MARLHWNHPQGLDALDFTCGHCGREVASARGYQTTDATYRTYICPRCERTSFWSHSGEIVPGPPFGNEVAALPHEIASLYKEARSCIQAGAHTSAVLTCRKILMHAAVEQGAPEGGNFLSYVEYMADKGYVPPHGRKWVDHIRTRGNEANHEIVVMEQYDAIQLVSFVEMLLKFIYELPSLVPEPSEPSGPE